MAIEREYSRSYERDRPAAPNLSGIFSEMNEIFVCGQNDNDAILIWFLTQIESFRRSVHSNFCLLSCPPGYFERESPIAHCRKIAQM